jgi:hypothetical protein
MKLLPNSIKVIILFHWIISRIYLKKIHIQVDAIECTITIFLLYGCVTIKLALIKFLYEFFYKFRCERSSLT